MARCATIPRRRRPCLTARFPPALLQRLDRQPGTWAEVFGEDADEFFHAWSIGWYVGQVAEAGKAEYPLPMYANAALRDPVNDQDPMTYASGGPTWNVIEVWQAAAPAIDFLSPDIYERGSVVYEGIWTAMPGRTTPCSWPRRATTRPMPAICSR